MSKLGVYFLRCKNGRYYIGSTNDLERRFDEHGRGHVRATRDVRPLEVVFFQSCDSIKYARQLELRLKKLKRRDIIERIIIEKRIDIMRP